MPRASWLGGALRLYPWSTAEDELYVQLRDEVALDPRIPSLERPDLLCLVIARRTGAVLLTENLGVLRVVQFHPAYSRVTAWTALEVLEQMVYRGLVEVGVPRSSSTLSRSTARTRGTFLAAGG